MRKIDITYISWVLALGMLLFVAADCTTAAAAGANNGTTAGYAPFEGNAGATVQAAVYVSPTGNDDNPGTDMAPFATLQKAQAAVREGNASMTGDILIWLAGGTYNQTETWNLNENDSGTNGYSVIYRAQEGQTPVISGKKQIIGWTIHDPQKNIYQADASGITTRQLFVNGIRATRARTSGELTNSVKTADGFTSDDIGLAAIGNQSQLQYVFRADWTNPRISVQSITEQNGKAVISLQQPLWNSLMNRTRLVQWYLENAYEFIDEPGEWYLDDTTHKIYYKPRPGESMDTADVTAPVVETLVRLQGSSLDSPVHHIRFEGITFADTTWMAPTANGGWVDGMNNFPDASGAMVMPAAAVEVKRANSLGWMRCTFTRLGSTGINLSQGVQDSLIAGSRFYDLSGGAMNIGESTKTSADIYNPADPRLVMRNNDVLNNYIHDVSVEYMGAAAIDAGFPQDMNISHNEIFNIPYSGICLFGSVYAPTTATKNVRIEDNFIHDLLGQRIFDGGAIYSFGVTGGTADNPNMISGNYIKNQMNRYAAVYLDQSTNHWSVRENVIDLSENLIWDDIYNPNWGYVNIKGSNNIFDGNYTTTASFMNGSTDPNPITDTHVHQDAAWPAAAQQILLHAGLEPAYQDVQHDVIERLVAPNSINLQTGQAAALNIHAQTGRDQPQDISSAQFYYESSEPSVALVSEDGHITAISSGSAEIAVYVYYSGALTKKVIPVYVDDALQSIELYYAQENQKFVLGDSLTFGVGSSRQLIARGVTQNGQKLPNLNMSFTSGNPSAASVVNGLLTTISAGDSQVTVTASLNGVQVSRTVTVHVLEYTDTVDRSAASYSINEALRSPKGWHLNLSTSKAAVGEGTLEVNTPGNGFATYRARTFGDDLLSMNMKINAVSGWPSIVLRVQNPYKDFTAADNSLYMICFKPGFLELQRFTGGQRSMIYGEISGVGSVVGASVPSPLSYNENHFVQAGAINEANGVRIVLYVDGQNVFSYLDTDAQRIASDGYWGLYARSGSILLGETHLGLPGEDVYPPPEAPAGALTGVDKAYRGENFTLTGSLAPNRHLALHTATLTYDSSRLDFAAVSSMLPGIQTQADASVPGSVILSFTDSGGQAPSLSGFDEMKLFAAAFRSKQESGAAQIALSDLSLTDATGAPVTAPAVQKNVVIYTPVIGAVYESFDSYANGPLAGTGDYLDTAGSNSTYFVVAPSPTAADKSLHIVKAGTADAVPSTLTKMYSPGGIGGKVALSYQWMTPSLDDTAQTFINIRDNANRVIATVIADSSIHVKLAADQSLVVPGNLQAGMWYLITLQLDFDAHTVEIAAKELSGEQRTFALAAQSMQNPAASNFSRMEYVVWNTRSADCYYNNLSVEPVGSPSVTLSGAGDVRIGHSFTLTGTATSNGSLNLQSATIAYDSASFDFVEAAAPLQQGQVAADTSLTGIVSLTYPGGLQLEGNSARKIFTVTFKPKGNAGSAQIALSNASFTNMDQAIITASAPPKALAVALPGPGAIDEDFDSYADGTVVGANGYQAAAADNSYFSIASFPAAADKSLHLFKTNTNDSGPPTLSKVYSPAGMSGRVKLTYLMLSPALAGNQQSFINLRDTNNKTSATIVMDTAIHAVFASNRIIVPSSALQADMWYSVTVILDYDTHLADITVSELGGANRSWFLAGQSMQKADAINLSKVEYVLWNSATADYYYNNLSIEALQP
ncbi:MAG: hypothetical protein K0R57_3775 [Paenibacillaceae bacterium]|jgi:hypothetical protein|nr:hypothetical protein [Paenibacillaceae bacterium]